LKDPQKILKGNADLAKRVLGISGARGSIKAFLFDATKFEEAGL
jgi:hypothetical protein